MLWLEVCPTNKYSFVVAGYCLQAVSKYGMLSTLSIHAEVVHKNNIIITSGYPKIICSERGSENAKITFIEPFLRRNGTDGYSVENSSTMVDQLTTRY